MKQIEIKIKTARVAYKSHPVTIAWVDVRKASHEKSVHVEVRFPEDSYNANDAKHHDGRNSIMYDMLQSFVDELAAAEEWATKFLLYGPAGCADTTVH